MSTPKQQYINKKIGLKDVAKEIPGAAKKVAKGIGKAGEELGKVTAQMYGVNMDWDKEREAVKKMFKK